MVNMQFILIPNQQILHRACILIELNNCGSKRGNKMIEHVFMEYIPVPKQQDIVPTKTKVDNYRSRYIWPSVSKEGYQQEIELCVTPKGIFACSKSSVAPPYDLDSCRFQCSQLATVHSSWFLTHLVVIGVICSACFAPVWHSG